MRPDEFLLWVKASPFRPFRVTLNSGRTFDIRHPEMVKVGKSTLMLFRYRGEEPEDPYESAQMIGLVLIESIEPIEVARSA